MQTLYDPAETLWMQEEGDNSLHGSALIRQAGGGIVTCAGNIVYLAPDSTYATEYFNVAFGNANKGYVIVDTLEIVNLSQEFLADRLVTTCDTLGKFTFGNLPDGKYYLVSSIFWFVGGLKQGGTMMQKVELRDGETINTVLVP